MVHYDRCPLCSSERTGSHLTVRDNFLTFEEFELYKCYDCGFLFTQDPPEEIHAGRYYESDNYVSHDDSVKDVSGKLYRFARKLMLKRKRAFIENSTRIKKGSLLDLGCGTGHFLSVMKKGWNVKGVEINEKARLYAVSVFDLDIILPCQLSSLAPESFDCITMWHTLEHFHDPSAYISEVNRLLKPGGFCVAALPNSGSYDAGYYKEYWAAFDVPRHLWHFTPDTFKMFAEKAGFKILKIRTLPLDVFYISALSEKYKGSKLHFIRGIIKGFWFFLLSLVNSGKSSSLVYLLKKQNNK